MEIEWSLLASRQMDEILDFVEAEYGSMTAKKVLEKLTEKSESRYIRFGFVGFSIHS